MALTTYVKGRAYDWSHAIGRASANGTGFNYLADDVPGERRRRLCRQSRQREQLRHAGQPRQSRRPGRGGVARRVLQHGEDDGKTIWPFGVAVDKDGHVYVTDEWTSTVSVFDAKGKFIRKWGTPGSGPGELRGRPASSASRTAT